MMKRRWIPTAVVGALGLGYLAGMGSGESHVRELPPERVPPAVAPAPTLPPVSPAVPPVSESPPAPARYLQPVDEVGEYPAWNGVDLDCKDVGHPVRVPGRDPHRLDQDGNGIGCESY
jgi:micrococcal nuclease